MTEELECWSLIKLTAKQVLLDRKPRVVLWSLLRVAAVLDLLHVIFF
jgi:hypothetical protein